MHSISVAALLLLVGSCQAFWGIKTVDELDVGKYTGVWFEAYSSLIQKWTFQRNLVCTSATYGQNADGTISVINSGRIKTPTGDENKISGTAFLVDPKVPGKLKVQFPGSPKGDYWVVKLGPLNARGEYSYSIITAPFKSFLWVLVRDVAEYKSKHDAGVQKYLSDNGYNWFWNRPRVTYQGKDCIYPSQ